MQFREGHVLRAKAFRERWQSMHELSLLFLTARRRRTPGDFVIGQSHWSFQLYYIISTPPVTRAKTVAPFLVETV
jgi:hypothetical protein